MASTQKQNILTKTALAASFTGPKADLPPRSKDFIFILTAANVNAATTVAVKIQHSPDGTTFFDLATFTNIVGAAGSGIQVVSGAVLPYVRALVTLTGATQLADVTVDAFYQPQGY